jgi:hypothetical protein
VFFGGDGQQLLRLILRLLQILLRLAKVRVALLLLLGLALFTHVIFVRQNTVRLMTDSVVHVTNLTPPVDDSRYGPRDTSMVHVTNLTSGCERSPTFSCLRRATSA